MLTRALVLIPFVLVFSCGPGFFFLRRLRWSPLEKINGSVALSLLLLGGLTFGVYWTGLPRAFIYLITAVAASLTLAALPDGWRLARGRCIRETLVPFGCLVVWTLGAQALIRHYSGGDWCCDWVEHYQKSLFFLERWRKDFLFIDRYLVTARPPFMNVICTFFLANVGTEFVLYQIVFSLLNLLVFLPCCLFARRFAPRVRRLPWLVAIFLAFNPTFFMNTTFPWTKALAAFFVILSVCLYLAAWRKHDSIRMSAAFVCLSVGILVHFSAVPYALFLAPAYLTSIWPWQRRRMRDLAIVGTPGAILLVLWLAWSLGDYGAAATFTANTAVQGAAKGNLSENAVRIALNIWHTFRPYLFPGQPEDTPLRLLTDRAFTFYQENFLGAMGLVDAWVAAWIVTAALWWKQPSIRRRERLFWSGFVPFTILLGIAVDGDVSPSGVANISLQPLAYLAATLVAARYSSFGRTARAAIWGGLLVDLVLGIALEVHMESRMQLWARTLNWDWKERLQLVFLGDLLRKSASGIEVAMAVAAAAALCYVALAPTTRTVRATAPTTAIP